MRKFFLAIAVMAALAPVLGAQTLSVNAPGIVASDEQFNVTFTIDGDKAPTDFQWSPGGDFKLVWGPQKGTSTSINIVNGKTTRISTTTYTYVLMPKSSGNFTIAPATATVRGKTVSSEAKTIQVVSGGQGQSQGQATGAQGSQQGSRAGSISSSDIFLRLDLSKSSAYVGEGITATLKLYQRVKVAGFEDAKFPSFNGFWNQELQAPTNIEFHRETVGGEIYNAALLRSWSLIPQKSGEMTIDPAELVCLVNVRNASSGTGSIFDSFFQDDYRTIRKRVSTPAIKVQVKPLPSGAPASFAGGVGKFAMRASLTRDSLKAHDAASLVVTVSGNGNTSLLEAPRLNFPPDFEVYDVKSTSVKGGKSFEYPFIPRSHGDFVVGPVEYTYFDPAAGSYVTLQSAPMNLHVAGTPGSQAAASVSSGGQLVDARKEVKDLGSDIRYISTKAPAFKPAGRFFVWSPLFWSLAAVLLSVAAALFLALRKLAARRADVVGTRGRGAVKMARRRLAQAGEFLQKNLYTAFYEELHRTLLGFVSDKLNMPAADMNRDNIADRLSAAGVSADLAQEFCRLLDECEYARYAPNAGHDAMNAHYESAVSIISRIDSSMKKKPTIKGAALIMALMLLPVSGFASDYADSLWTKGTEAYAAGRFDEARDAWQSLVSAGFASPELYTNLGDACFKTEDYARTILYYERALKLDPSYKDARINLKFAQTKLQDRLEAVPEFFLVSWIRSLGWKLSSDAWAILFLFLFAGFLAGFLLFLLGHAPASRRAGFFAGVALLLLSLGALGFASWQKKDFVRADKAVVMSPVISVKSAPGAGDGKDLFILHEGAKVRVVDSASGWVSIELSDGRQGWITAESVEII